MEKNKKEELQSRRDFFKSAAKVALPVIGAAIFSQLPIKTQASEMGCTGTCYGRCDGSCRGCYTTCTGTCDGSCRNTCQYSSK